jgi:hypothetical protein
MSKELKIISSYCIIVGLTFICLLRIARSHFATDEEGEFLAYDWELYRYRMPCKPSAVLVGPSYVNALGGFDDKLLNLGYPGAFPKEIALLTEKYCPKEKIFYGINIWVPLALKNSPRTLPFSNIERYRFAIKALFFGIEHKDRRDLFLRSLPSWAAKVPQEKIVDSVHWLQALHERYPNVSFILFPVHSPDIDAANLKNEMFRTEILKTRY